MAKKRPIVETSLRMGREKRMTRDGRKKTKKKKHELVKNLLGKTHLHNNDHKNTKSVFEPQTKTW